MSCSALFEAMMLTLLSGFEPGCRNRLLMYGFIVRAAQAGGRLKARELLPFRQWGCAGLVKHLDECHVHMLEMKPFLGLMHVKSTVWSGKSSCCAMGLPCQSPQRRRGHHFLLSTVPSGFLNRKQPASDLPQVAPVWHRRVAMLLQRQRRRFRSHECADQQGKP